MSFSIETWVAISGIGSAVATQALNYALNKSRVRNDSQRLGLDARSSLFHDSSKYREELRSDLKTAKEDVVVLRSRLDILENHNMNLADENKSLKQRIGLLEIELDQLRESVTRDLHAMTTGDLDK